MRLVEHVRVSSKGQIVIPAPLRRALGLKTGRRLRATVRGDREIVLCLDLERGERLEPALERARAWTERTGRDLVEELHARRARERARAGRSRQ